MSEETMKTNQPATVLLGGKEWRRIPYGRESDADLGSYETCPDCTAKPGTLHAAGCDVEQCPACGCQLLACQGMERHEEKSSGAWDSGPWAGDPDGPPPPKG